MFGGFESSLVDAGETTIFIRRKGVGPPLLLLHGFPQTHVMWHRVAPVLAEDFTVICADLHGYGASGKFRSGTGYEPYSKSASALDMVRMMEVQGFTRFSVAGHDRGGRVAYRLALDHPDRLERVALLDIIPTGEALQRADARFMFAFWPWSLLAQPAPLPERLLGAATDAVVDDALTKWGSDPSAFPPEVRTVYIEALRDPAALHAVCEEYRAAATVDAARDVADREAGHTIASPLLVLWGAGGPLDTWYGDAGGPLGIWRNWAQDVRGRSMNGGHFFPEANHTETAEELRSFFLNADGSALSKRI
jgi:haloacetate dehalogenase